MKGCKNCPAYAKCTVTYRGSACAALRSTYGIDTDPEIITNADRIRPCLKNVNKPKQRIFFRHTALIFLAIHKVLLRQIALSGEKISRRWAHFQFSNRT